MTTSSEPRLSDLVVVARAVVLALVVLGAGAISHVVGDGLLPPVGALLLLLVATTVGCALFLHRPAGALRLAALLVGGQAVVHLALSATAGHAGSTAAATPPVPLLPVEEATSLRSAYHAQQDAIWASGSTGADPLAHLVGHALEAGPLMVVAHSGAAALVGLWLAVGERALATLLALGARNVRRALGALLALVAVALPHRVPAPPVAAGRLHARPGDVVRRALARRGPPLLPCSR